MNHFARIFSLFFFLLSSFVIANEAEKKYNFSAHWLKDTKTQINFTYKNQDSKAHCIKETDFSSGFHSDDFYVIDAKNTVLEYTGRTDRRLPSGPAFLIIPPGKGYTFSVDITKSYPIKGPVKVSLSVPVINCDAILQHYVRMPYVSQIKYRVKDPVSDDESALRDDFTDWADNGFIAVSTSAQMN